MLTAKCKISNVSRNRATITMIGHDIGGSDILVTIDGPEDQLKPFLQGSPLVLVIADGEGLNEERIERRSEVQL